MDKRQSPDGGVPAPGAEGVERSMLLIARMFAPHRDNELMRSLCRLALKCVQEGVTRG
jgi:hypothetical protein